MLSTSVKETIAKVATLAGALWQWTKPKKAIGWLVIAEFLFNLFQNCKPKEEAKADKTLKSIFVEIAEKGVNGCCDVVIDRVPKRKQKKARKRLMNELDTTNENHADRVLFTLATAANAHRLEVAGALKTATANNEYEDEDAEE